MLPEMYMISFRKRETYKNSWNVYCVRYDILAQKIMSREFLIFEESRQKQDETRVAK